MQLEAKTELSNRCPRAQVEVCMHVLNQYMTSESRGHCDNVKVFNQGKSNQIREKSGNLIAKNVWPP